jgi:lipoyl(octanoyl) transferase
MRDHEVAIVINRGPEFLVLLRAPDGGSYWHLPAGGVEGDESEIEAAVRELAEETGLRAEVHDLGLALGYDAPGGQVRVGMFAVEAPSGWEPTLNDEHVEYRWCLEADALALLRYPEPRIALEHAARRLEAV